MYARKKITDVKPTDTIMMPILGIPHSEHPVEVHVKSAKVIDKGRVAITGQTSDTRMHSPVFERGFEPDDTVIVLCDGLELNFSGIDTGERPAYRLRRADSFIVRSVAKIGQDTVVPSFKVVTVVALAHEGDMVHVICAEAGTLQEITLPATKRVRVVSSASAA